MAQVVDLTAFLANELEFHFAERVITVSDDLPGDLEDALIALAQRGTQATAEGKKLDFLHPELFALVAKILGLPEEEVIGYGPMTAWQVVTPFFLRYTKVRLAQQELLTPSVSSDGTTEASTSETSSEAAD